MWNKQKANKGLNTLLVRPVTDAMLRAICLKLVLAVISDSNLAQQNTTGASSGILLQAAHWWITNTFILRGDIDGHWLHHHNSREGQLMSYEVYFNGIPNCLKYLNYAFIFFFFNFFLAMPHSMWDLSSLTRAPPAVGVWSLNHCTTREVPHLLLLLFLKNYLFIYLFLAALGLCCSTQAFSSCIEWGLLLVVVLGLLIAVASLVVEQGSRCTGFSSCGTRAQ